MRANRSKVGKRRSHLALTAASSTRCECGALKRPHRACAACGKYRDHVATDVVAAAERDAKRTKRREKDLRASGKISATKEADKESAS
jgi:ribosomal protein L32